METFDAGKDRGGGEALCNEPEHLIQRAAASLSLHPSTVCPSILSARAALMTLMEMAVSASPPTLSSLVIPSLYLSLFLQNPSSCSRLSKLPPKAVCHQETPQGNKNDPETEHRERRWEWGFWWAVADLPLFEVYICLRKKRKKKKERRNVCCVIKVQVQRFHYGVAAS